jgi:D-threo-aldose 1-dehydrogenase
MKLKDKQALGRTGLQVPRVIYGTSYLGNLYRELPYREKLELMERWFRCTEKPVVIDTAGKYGAGLALEVIGKGLSELGIDAGEVVISNKLGWYRVPLRGKEPAFEPGAWAGLKHDCVQKFGYQGILNCYEQGEELLGPVYHAEVVSVHDPDEYLLAAETADERARRKTAILESYRALFELKSRGRVRAVGIGAKDWTIIRELYADVRFDWVMFANSFTIYRHPEKILRFMDRLDRDGVGIINSAVFHGGFLTGGDKFDYRDVDPDSEFGGTLFAWRASYFSLCAEYGIEPGDAALHFALSHPAVVGIALNTSKPDKMNRNVEILQEEIPASFWTALKERALIDPDYQYV